MHLRDALLSLLLRLMVGLHLQSARCSPIPMETAMALREEAMVEAAALALWSGWPRQAQGR